MAISHLGDLLWSSYHKEGSTMAGGQGVERKMPATGFQPLVFVPATAISFQLKVWGPFGMMLSFSDLLRCLVSV